MDKVDFSQPLNLLRNIGVHPDADDRFWRLRHCFSIAVYVTTMSSGTLEILFNSEGLETYARAADTMVPMYQLLAKMLVLIIKRQEVRRLLKQSRKFWDLSEFGSEYLKEVSGTHAVLRRFFAFYKYAIAFTCVQFLAVKILTSPKPLCISFGENLEHGSGYDHFYLVLHGLVVVISINIIVGFDALFFYFIGHTLSELKMVRIAFGEEKISKKWDAGERFRSAAKHHSEALEFIEKLDEVFSKVFLIQHLSSLFGICFGLFLMTQHGFPPSVDLASKYMPYIISFTLQTWIFCFAGQLVYDWVFYNGWDIDYGYENVEGRLISINRGQKGVKLTLGGFGDLNLETFKLVLQKVFSFLAFINTMMEKKK